jgi:hypothetical protein
VKALGPCCCMRTLRRLVWQVGWTSSDVEIGERRVFSNGDIKINVKLYIPLGFFKRRAPTQHTQTRRHSPRRADDRTDPTHPHSGWRVAASCRGRGRPARRLQRIFRTGWPLAVGHTLLAPPGPGVTAPVRGEPKPRAGRRLLPHGKGWFGGALLKIIKRTHRSHITNFSHPRCRPRLDAMTCA